ncbi:MAG: heavy metal-binding domain-containing protein [Phycisphaerales bacterium]|jgi:uncharacterized protein YbjQ (UPF0145 family)|nr:heavy metal-binding domain-containing protein [Phycisphaerales bacterium]
MSDFINILLLASPVILIAMGFIIGKVIESRHFRSLAQREAGGGPLLTNLKYLPDGQTPQATKFCIGGVVIASDYFKTFGAKLKSLVGGRLRTIETMLERGRREALLRLREQAAEFGADVVISIRLETAVIMKNKQGKSYPAAEVIAYGTAVRTTANDNI